MRYDIVGWLTVAAIALSACAGPQIEVGHDTSEGVRIDPDGRSVSQGSCIDPLGRTASSDFGCGMDPDG